MELNTSCLEKYPVVNEIEIDKILASKIEKSPLKLIILDDEIACSSHATRAIKQIKGEYCRAKSVNKAINKVTIF